MPWASSMTRWSFKQLKAQLELVRAGRVRPIEFTKVTEVTADM